MALMVRLIDFRFLLSREYSNLRRVGSQQLEQAETGVYTSPWIKPARSTALLLFLVTLALTVLSLVTRGSTPEWLLLAVLLATFFVAAMSLFRILPVQNVVTVTMLAGIIGALADFGATQVGLPSMPARQLHNTAQPLLPHLTVGLIWIVALLSSRGAARFFLNRGLRKGAHGIRVIALTSTLVMLIASAARVASAPTGTIQGIAALLIFALLWGAGSVATLIATTPWLINKKPAPEPQDAHPLILWCSLMVLFVMAAVVR